MHAASPDLDFEVIGARPLAHTAVPTLGFQILIRRTGGGPVRSVLLNTAIRIAPARRRYDSPTQERLVEIFGTSERWATTLRPLTWTQMSSVVPPFDDTTVFDLHVPCPCAVELAVVKYFRAVRDGEVPLDFLFSGTVFHSAADGALHTAQISWASDASFLLAGSLWREATGDHAWIRLTRTGHDRLDAHRARNALADWDEAIRDLLDRTAAPTAADTTGAAWTP
ncbi:DUF6084 family protein [Streptomyces sp. NPDC002896]|uniref:DUF6084 family protein n=1 Tax=Streptomyces sp. NPDC002896 TaxID=3154438 RepID=UPI0033328AED